VERRDVLDALRVGCALLVLLLPALLTHPARAAAASDEGKGHPLSVNPPPDPAIQQRIEGILSALGGVEALHVEVKSGVVHLGGRADSLALREQATDLASRVDGVVLVRNDLEAATDVRGRLGPTWAKLKGYLSRMLGFLPVLGVALLAFFGFAFLGTAVGRWERPFRRLGLSDLGSGVLRVALRALLIVAGLVLALDILGLVAFVGTVVGALGVLGVVAGIAFRDVVANYLPGIILGLNPPFGPGDRVQIGEHEGRVVRVTPRETILVENNGQHLRIPNVRLLQLSIVNFERHRERRLHFPLDIALSADLRRVRDLGRATLVSMPGILPKPTPLMRVLAIEADLVRVAFYAWADQQATSFHDLESRARQAVKEALLTAGVSFPIREIAVHQGPTDAASRELEGEGPDGPEAALLDAHLREEQTAIGERDLLRKGGTRRAGAARDARDESASRDGGGLQ
jgi:small-conductance mechanosensitive channel